MTIEFYDSCNERTKTFHRAKAEVVTEEPKIGDSYAGGTIVHIQSAWLDPEQPRSEVWDYSILEVTVRYDQEDDLEERKYVAVEPKPEEPRFRVLPEFVASWYGSQSAAETDAGQEAGLTMEEIERLSREWGTPIEELMEQVEEI